MQLSNINLTRSQAYECNQLLGSHLLAQFCKLCHHVFFQILVLIFAPLLWFPSLSSQKLICEYDLLEFQICVVHVGFCKLLYFPSLFFLANTFHPCYGNKSFLYLQKGVMCIISFLCSEQVVYLAERLKRLNEIKLCYTVQNRSMQNRSLLA